MDQRIAEVETEIKQLKNIRKPHEDVWDEIVDQLFPYRWGAWDNKEQRGKRTGSEIYDSYPLQMLNIMADGIQGHMVSDSFRWMTPYLSKATKNPTIKKWLQDTEDQFYFEFQRSNFYEAINEYIQDAGSIGTAHMYAQESSTADKIVYKVLHPREVWVAENFDGLVDTHYREFYLTVKQAYEKFGAYHESIERRLRHQQQYQEIRFVHVVKPRIGGGGMAPEDRPYESLYIDMENQVTVRESGYFVNPFATWRWRKLSHETYGRSPAWEALRDIKMLNQMEKTLLVSGQRHADPPLMVPAEMKTEFDRRAGALNYYADPNRIPFQLTERSNFPIGQEREDQKRQIIRDAFKVDFFLMLQQAEREMTATEIIEKQNEKIAILGAVIGRFQTEALNPLIDITYDIASRAGRMPEPPDIVKELYGGERVDIDYTGPLAQAQKRLRMQGTQAALQTVLPYAQFDPTVMDRINMDIVARDLMESYGMRQEAIRSDQEVQALRQQRAQAQMAQMQMEAQESQARANRDNGQAAQASEAVNVMRGR